MCARVRVCVCVCVCVCVHIRRLGIGGGREGSIKARHRYPRGRGDGRVQEDPFRPALPWGWGCGRVAPAACSGPALGSLQHEGLLGRR